MDNQNYVAPYNGGFIVVVNGQQVGGLYGSQADAENAYNAAHGGSNSSGSNPSPASGSLDDIKNQLRNAGYPGPWDDASVIAAYQRTVNGGNAGPLAGYMPGSESITVGDYDWASLATQQKIAELQDAYNRARLALDAIQGFAAETGWIDPSMLSQFLTAAGMTAGGGAGTYTRNDTGETKSIQQMRNELVGAGGDYWNTASDEQVISEYGKLAGGITQNTGTGNAPNGGQLTFAGAAQAAQGYALGDTLGGLGLTPESLPTYGDIQNKYPTLAMQEIMGDPNTLVQSLLMTGMSPEQVATYLEGSPVVQQLVQQAYGAPSVPQAVATAPAMQPQTVVTNQNGGAAGGPSAQPGAFSMPNTPGVPNTPGFDFIQGNKMPAREFLHQLNTKDPMVGAYLSMADFAGYKPENWLSEFQNVMPKGGRNPLTSFI